MVAPSYKHSILYVYWKSAIEKLKHSNIITFAIRRTEILGYYIILDRILKQTKEIKNLL